MNVIELLETTKLFEEMGGKALLLLDIDETLLVPDNIYIYRKLPTDKKEVALTPKEYAKETVTPDTKKYYDYREFKNPNKIGNSIKTGIPIISNLKIMDEYIKQGWKVGILTARGMEDVIFKSIKAWLMFRDKKGNLQDIGDKLIRNLVFAINDDEKKYPGDTDFERKANVIKKLSKKFNQVIFADDDKRNILAVKKMIKKEGIRNVMVKLAVKPGK